MTFSVVIQSASGHLINPYSPPSIARVTIGQGQPKTGRHAGAMMWSVWVSVPWQRAGQKRIARGSEKTEDIWHIPLGIFIPLFED